MTLTAYEFDEELPEFRGPASIPNIGELGGDPTFFVNGQLGSMPDLNGLIHMQSLEWLYTEFIFTYLEGQLPDAARPAVYEAERLVMVARKAQMLAARGALAATLNAEVSSSINYVNQKITQQGNEIGALEDIPPERRSKIEQLRLQRKTEAREENQAKLGRLQALSDWLGAL